MSEQPQHNDFQPQAPAEPEAVVLIKKLQQQLVFLEKKIDILIEQSKAGAFSRPARSFDRKPDRPRGEKDFYSGRHFEKRHGSQSRGFGYEKKPYENSQEGNFSQERNFKKRYEGKKRSFDQGKKPFYFKRKENSR